MLRQPRSKRRWQTSPICPHREGRERGTWSCRRKPYSQFSRIQTTYFKVRGGYFGVAAQVDLQLPCDSSKLPGPGPFFKTDCLKADRVAAWVRIPGGLARLARETSIVNVEQYNGICAGLPFGRTCGLFSRAATPVATCMPLLLNKLCYNSEKSPHGPESSTP